MARYHVTVVVVAMFASATSCSSLQPVGMCGKCSNSEKTIHTHRQQNQSTNGHGKRITRCTNRLDETWIIYAYTNDAIITIIRSNSSGFESVARRNYHKLELKQQKCQAETTTENNNWNLSKRMLIYYSMLFKSKISQLKFKNRCHCRRNKCQIKTSMLGKAIY